MTKTAKTFLILEIISFISLIILSFFAQPQADDFGFANSLNKFDWLGSQINWYKTWFGRFSSTMLIISGLYVDFTILCKVFPILILSGYLFAFYLISGKLFVEIPNLLRWILAFSFMFLFVSEMPSLSQGVYWFTAAATYAVANILMIIFFALFDSFHKTTGYIALILSGVFIIGSNETAMLVLMVFVCAELLINIKEKKLWLILAIFAACSLIVALSPGNTLRSQMFEQNHNLLVAVLKSSKTMILLITKWLCNPLLWIVMALFIYLRAKFKLKIVTTNIKSGIIIFFMLFLIFCTLFPAFWSVNGRPPERALNTSYLIFLFLVVYSVCFGKIGGFMEKAMNKKLFLSVLSGWLIVNIYIGSLDLPQRKDFSFYLKHPREAAHFILISTNQNNWIDVYADLFSGKAANYRKTMLEREEKIKNYKGGLICLPKAEKIPRSIIYQDLTEDSGQWINKVFAEYHHLEKVALCEK